jgi:ABC-type branched-subunit amino acid transport system substrate-binding protein
VKNKVLLISLAVVFVIGLSLVGCAPEELPPTAPDYIYIFASRSISGPLSVFEGTAMGPIYKYWRHVVNDVEGGILVPEFSEKVKVYIDVKDDSSDMSTMTSNYQTYLSTGKYVATIGPCCTPFLQAAGPISSQYGVPLVGAEGGCTSVAETMASYPYMFSNLAFSNWNQVPALCAMLDKWAAKESDGKIDVYLLSIDDLFGYEYTGQFEKFSADYPNTIKIVGELKHPPFSTAEVVGPQVEQAAAAGADVLILNTYPPTPFEAVGYAIAHGLNFKGIVTGPAACYEGWYLTFGANSVGVCGYGAWNEYSSTALHDFAVSIVDWLATGMEGTPGRSLMDWWGGHYYYTGLQMLEKAIGAAGNYTPKAIRDVMATQKLQTILGTTYYTTYNGTFPIGSSGGLLAIACHVGEVGQWQHVTAANNWLPDGATGTARTKPTGIAADATEYYIFEVVAPSNLKTADWIYPKPNWVS